MKHLITISLLFFLTACSGSGGGPTSPADPTSDLGPTVKSVEIIDFQFNPDGLYIYMTSASFKNTGNVNLSNLRITFSVTIQTDPYHERKMFNTIADISVYAGNTYTTAPNSQWVDIFDYRTFGTHYITMSVTDMDGDISVSMQKTFER